MDNDTPERSTRAETISWLNWFWTLLAMSIPLVNIAFCLYWAFSRQTNPSKRNFAIAFLIWCVITVAFYIMLASWTSSLFSGLDIDSAHYSSQSSGVSL